MYSEHKDESAFIVVVGNKIDVKKYICELVGFQSRWKRRRVLLSRVSSIFKCRLKQEKE
jgi:hypothetical protein